MGKERLDELLVSRGLAATLDEARAVIGAGNVVVGDCVADKAGSVFPADCRIELKKKKPYVSRGGEKLAAALTAFRVDPAGLICGDIGCSTGGFTDCLLQHGASRVYSVDVGYGVLDWRLRNDVRVVVLERTNARYLTRKEIPEPLELAVIDASFISLELLLQPIAGLFAGKVSIIALVKPQFELPRGKVARGGVVRDSALHEEAVEMVAGYAAGAGLSCAAATASPIKGAKGNREFLMHLVSDADWKPERGAKSSGAR